LTDAHDASITTRDETEAMEANYKELGKIGQTWSESPIDRLIPAPFVYPNLLRRSIGSTQGSQHYFQELTGSNSRRRNHGSEI